MRSITIERDLAVPMRDGARLSANLFRPAANGPFPVIMSVTPYGKDKLPDRLATFFMRLSGVKFGTINCSPLTGFEAPDPVYWVQQGYAVLQADVRGMHNSEGHAGVLRQQDAEDYYDLVEWGGVPAVVHGAGRTHGRFSIWRCRNGTSRPSNRRTCVRSSRGKA